MTVDLLPCPFCGTNDHVYPGHRWPGTGEPYEIDCVRCGFDFTPREGMDVIAAWNRRAVPVRVEPMPTGCACNADAERIHGLFIWCPIAAAVWLAAGALYWFGGA